MQIALFSDLDDASVADIERLDREDPSVIDGYFAVHLLKSRGSDLGPQERVIQRFLEAGCARRGDWVERLCGVAWWTEVHAASATPSRTPLAQRWLDAAIDHDPGRAGLAAMGLVLPFCSEGLQSTLSPIDVARPELVRTLYDRVDMYRPVVVMTARPVSDSSLSSPSPSSPFSFDPSRESDSSVSALRSACPEAIVPDASSRSVLRRFAHAFNLPSSVTLRKIIHQGKSTLELRADEPVRQTVALSPAAAMFLVSGPSWRLSGSLSKDDRPVPVLELKSGLDRFPDALFIVDESAPHRVIREDLLGVVMPMNGAQVQKTVMDLANWSAPDVKRRLSLEAQSIVDTPTCHKLAPILLRELIRAGARPQSGDFEPWMTVSGGAFGWNKMGRSKHYLIPDSNDLSVFEQLLRERAVSPDSMSAGGLPFLVCAVFDGRTDLLELLLRYQADPRHPEIERICRDMIGTGVSHDYKTSESDAPIVRLCALQGHTPSMIHHMIACLRSALVRQDLNVLLSSSITGVDAERAERAERPEREADARVSGTPAKRSPS
jgi:hypothetical protein